MKSTLRNSNQFLTEDVLMIFCFIWISWTSLKISCVFYGLRVPFVVSWCKFLKFIISKIFHEIVLAFLSVESKTNILYVNMNFTGNLLLAFGRYCSKVLPEPSAFHLFGATALINNVFPIFFSRWPVVNNSRSKRVSALLFHWFWNN